MCVFVYKYIYISNDKSSKRISVANIWSTDPWGGSKGTVIAICLRLNWVRTVYILICITWGLATLLNIRVGWDCWIRRLHLCKGVRPAEMSVLYMTLNCIWLWGDLKNAKYSSLPLLPCSLWLGLLVNVRLLYIGLLELFNYIIYLKPFSCWLVVWVLWHISLGRLFSAKSIFMQIVSSISNNSV